MNLLLTPELEKLIEAELKAGRSPTAAEFLSKAAFHYVVAREFGEDYTRDAIEQKIVVGLDQLERGDSVDGDEFFEKLRLRGEEFRRQRA